MEPKSNALNRLATMARNVRYAVEDGVTDDGELGWLEEQVERAARRALQAGCTMDKNTRTIRNQGHEEVR